MIASMLSLGGCTAMSPDACRGAHWFGLGQRDALVYGLRPQIDQYAEQCARHGVQTAEQEYLAGWYYGERERERRMAGSEP